MLKKVVSSNLEYLTDTTFSDYYRAAASTFPGLCSLLDEDAIKGDRLDDYVRVMNSLSWEFEDLADGGRGVAYNVAQKVVGNRQEGMVALLKCFSSTQRHARYRHQNSRCAWWRRDNCPVCCDP